jgi:hypothetical protein
LLPPDGNWWQIIAKGGWKLATDGKWRQMESDG